MLNAFLLALRQMGDPAFRGPLVKGVLGAMAVFASLALLAASALGALAGGDGWLAGVAAAAGGAAALALAVWLFVPVMLALAGLFLDPVAAAVERRFYPFLPPASMGASLGAQARFNIGLALRMGGLALLALPIGLLLPPLGGVLFWAIATVALGHGLFEGVAQRRMPVPAARAARRRQQTRVLGAGAILAALSLLPGLNLLVPVLGTAVMTHLLHRAPGASGTQG
jgi:CysZ protein